MPAPNLETVSVLKIVAIPTQLVVIPFLKVPFFLKRIRWPRGACSFSFTLGSTRWYLLALAYARDRHVTDVISVMSRQSRVMSAVCLSYRSVISEHSREFYLDYNRD